MPADVAFRPSHGENRGSSPLGSANKTNNLAFQACVSVPEVSRTAAIPADRHAHRRAGVYRQRARELAGDAQEWCDDARRQHLFDLAATYPRTAAHWRHLRRASC